MSEEVWKDVVGYEGVYEVSNRGRIKRILRCQGTRCGILRPGTRTFRWSTGIVKYNHVVLSYKSKVETRPVHRLVAEAFIPNPENKKTVNHKDGNGENNVVENLEWATQSEQELHKWHVLGHKITSKNFGFKSQRVICLTTGEIFDSIRLACEAKGVDRSCIRKCLDGEQNSTKGLRWARI